MVHPKDTDLKYNIPILSKMLYPYEMYGYTKGNIYI